MQNPNRLSAWEAQTKGRHWTKDGEGCCPVAMTTTGMYRLDRGGSCMEWVKKIKARYVRRGKKKNMKWGLINGAAQYPPGQTQR